MKKVIIAVTLVFTVLTIQGCDDNGGRAERVALRCGDVFTAALVRNGAQDTRRIVATEGVSGCSGTAVTVEGPESLNLNGHTVSCDGSAGSIGILLTGQGARVENGTVENCEAGVVAQGDGGHTMRDMTARDNFGERDVQLAGGFVIDSDDNTLRNVKASGNDPVGLQLIGSNNEVRDSDISDNDHAGIVIFGNSNEVSDTTSNNNNFGNISIVNPPENISLGEGENNVITNVTANGSKRLYGIYIGADFNTVSGSQADENDISGIMIFNDGQANTVTDNSAFNNNQSAVNGDDLGGTDLFQEPADVCDNTWFDNFFDTSNSECIN